MNEEQGKYKSILVARFLWAYADDKSYILNITKLQKLLYLIYGIYLLHTGNRLTDEPVHAWPYGPVFPKVSKDYKKNNNYQNLTIEDPLFDEIKKDDMLLFCIQSVLKKFGNWSAGQLVNFAHHENSAWTVTTKKQGFLWNDTIDDQDIKNYFNEIYTWKTIQQTQ